MYKKQIDLFSVPATLTSVGSGMYVDYRAISSVTGGALIKFDVNAIGEDYLNLANSLLHVRAKIVEANSDDLEAVNMVGPVNSFLHNLFFPSRRIVERHSNHEFDQHLTPTGRTLKPCLVMAVTQSCHS
jgi:hypothetical protein